jgi:hypothetical protein
VGEDSPQSPLRRAGVKFEPGVIMVPVGIYWRGIEWIIDININCSDVVISGSKES